MLRGVMFGVEQQVGDGGPMGVEGELPSEEEGLEGGVVGLVGESMEGSGGSGLSGMLKMPFGSVCSELEQGGIYMDIILKEGQGEIRYGLKD